MLRNKTKKFNTAVVELSDVIVIRPEKFSDIQTAIDSLMEQKPLGVSFEKANAELTQRFLDYLSGAIYALEGTVKQLTAKEFLFVPFGVEVVVPY